MVPETPPVILLGLGFIPAQSQINSSQLNSIASRSASLRFAVERGAQAAGEQASRRDGSGQFGMCSSLALTLEYLETCLFQRNLGRALVVAISFKAVHVALV